jgi:sugar fermentation stimulation protein A
MSAVFRPFGNLTTARFVSRPNRFMVKCAVEGRVVDAFLPNPGRLQELLLPGSVLYLTKEEESGNRKTSCTVVAVERDGLPVMLHTHKTNAAARYLLEKRLVPGLEDAVVERSEVPVGHSRFDFLLKDGKGEILLEVKSCTLFGKSVAMFPDAVTARGARHLQELAALSGSGARAAILFVVHWPLAEVFMPDYHTDLHFARTFLAVRESVGAFPVAVRWQQGLSIADEATLLDIPWLYIEQEAHDRGVYILILDLAEDCALPIGRKGELRFFRKGFYLYVGSAMANLTSRIERHLRLRKRFHWHIDWLRSVARVHAALPIRASVRLECDLADALSRAADWSVPGFGSSDCGCDTHLFGMTDDPLQSVGFHRLVQYFRMDRYSNGQGSTDDRLSSRRGTMTDEQ